VGGERDGGEVGRPRAPESCLQLEQPTPAATAPQEGIHTPSCCRYQGHPHHHILPAPAGRGRTRAMARVRAGAETEGLRLRTATIEHRLGPKGRRGW
jgi:hypothetical protein